MTAPIQEGVDETCVLCIVGNKLDLIDNGGARAVDTKEGERLADVRLIFIVDFLRFLPCKMGFY